jgi:CheY-like chemotaxis protein
MLVQIQSCVVASRPYPEPRADDLAQTSASANSRILIVNEDMRSADSLKCTLQGLGYTATFTAYSARRALATVAEFAPAMVILDLELPDMTGYQLARRFRSHLQRFVRQVPLLAIAEPLVSIDRERTLAAGFIGCLAKPVAQSELCSMLRRLRGPFM